jgi:hypothetical protein
MVHVYMPFTPEIVRFPLGDLAFKVYTLHFPDPFHYLLVYP